MIKQTVMGSMFTKMEHAMRATGKMICNMAKAKRFGLMAPITMAIMKWAKSKAKGLTYGLIVQNTMVTGLITRSTVLESTLGSTVVSTKENGEKTT